MTRPAREIPRIPAPKINRTRDEGNKWTNTHETPPVNTTEKKEKPHQKKKYSKKKNTITIQEEIKLNVHFIPTL
jgi:hypothetical protein